MASSKHPHKYELLNYINLKELMCDGITDFYTIISIQRHKQLGY